MTDVFSRLQASDVEGGLASLKTLLDDVDAAWKRRGKDVDKDLLVTEDVLRMLSGVPVVGTYAHEAQIGIAVLRFVIAHSDKNYVAKPPTPEGHSGTEGVQI